MSEVWVPGTGGPLDELVTRILLRVRAFVEEHGSRARVEVELREGPAAALRSIVAEPGSGFVTLVPHGDDGDDTIEEWIVPVAAVSRITLRAVAEEERFGFSLPDS